MHVPLLDVDGCVLQVEENLPPKSPIEFQKIRSDRIEREAFYIDKFRDYLFSKDLMARLDAKKFSIQKALGEGNWSGNQTTRYRQPGP